MVLAQDVLRVLHLPPERGDLIPEPCGHLVRLGVRRGPARGGRTILVLCGPRADRFFRVRLSITQIRKERPRPDARIRPAVRERANG